MKYYDARVKLVSTITAKPCHLALGHNLDRLLLHPYLVVNISILVRSVDYLQISGIVVKFRNGNAC